MRTEALQRAIRTDHYKYCIFDPTSRDQSQPHSQTTSSAIFTTCAPTRTST